MLFVYIRKIIGIINICIYKLLYFKRLEFHSFPKIDNAFDFVIEKNSKLVFGEKCKVRKNFSVKIRNNGRVSIGNDVFFNENNSINCRDKILIGNKCLFGPNVVIYDHDHDYKNNRNDFVTNEVIIKDNVWIGANVTILKGVTIGENSVIAAGTLVNKDVADNSLVFQKKEMVVRSI